MEDSHSPFHLPCLLLTDAGALAVEGRLLRQATYVTLRGHQPNGMYSVSDHAQAAAGGASRGIRYNGGRTIIAGDGYPSARSQAMTQFGARAQSGEAIDY